MKTIAIVGGRDFDFVEQFFDCVDDVVGSQHEYVTIISGGARGADSLAETYAIDNELQFEEYPAEWKVNGKYRREAGMVRNTKMAKAADIVIAFWNGRSAGTKQMIQESLKYGCEVHVYRY